MAAPATNLSCETNRPLVFESNVSAKDCRQLLFYADQSGDSDPDSTPINKEYPHFSMIDSRHKDLFKLTVDSTTEVWRLQISCPLTYTGTITCANKSTDLTIQLLSKYMVVGHINEILVLYGLIFQVRSKNTPANAQVTQLCTFYV